METVEVGGVAYSTLSLYAMTNQKVGKTSPEEGYEGYEVLRGANSMIFLDTCANPLIKKVVCWDTKHLPEFIALAARWVW